MGRPDFNNTPRAPPHSKTRCNEGSKKRRLCHSLPLINAAAGQEVLFGHPASVDHQPPSAACRPLRIALLLNPQKPKSQKTKTKQLLHPSMAHPPNRCGVRMSFTNLHHTGTRPQSNKV